MPRNEVRRQAELSVRDGDIQYLSRGCRVRDYTVAHGHHTMARVALVAQMEWNQAREIQLREMGNW